MLMVDRKRKSKSRVPEEERHYSETHRNLNISAQLRILKTPDQFIAEGLDGTPILAPINAVLSKPVLVPVFERICKDSGHQNCHSERILLPFQKFVGPTESQLLERVEYDMDDQDSNWVADFNKRTTIDLQLEFFEFIMDRLEKTWFKVVKDMPKSSRDEIPFPEDVICNVCCDGEAENTNAIVFCDGCNLSVHQDCYGVPFIPEGQWLCRKCMISPEAPVSCILCPNDNGPFKQTNTNKWAHLTCAMWVPEVRIANATFMEPIEGIEDIPKSRWKLVFSFLTAVMLYLQSEKGDTNSMLKQKLLCCLSCYMCPSGQIMHGD